MAARGIIVGAGRAGTYLHFGAHRAAGAEICAFVDQQLPLAQAAAKRLGVPAAYASLEEALAASNGVDFVDICTISSTHFPLTKQAIDAGCHVLVEKPLTETSEELEALQELHAQSGKAICVVHNHRCYPAVTKLIELVKAGDLGPIRTIHKEFMFNHEEIRMMEEGHWAHQIPGGRLFEANPHNLYLLYALVGELELVDIFPRKTSDRWPHARIDEFTAFLRNDDVSVSLRMSTHAQTDRYGKHGPHYFAVHGTKAAYYADYGRVEQLVPALGLGQRLRDKLLRRGPRPVDPGFKDAEGQPINVGIGSGHYWLIEQFDGFIEGRYPREPVPFEEAYFTQRMNLAMGQRVDQILAQTTA